jgi:hypothetical protein
VTGCRATICSDARPNRFRQLAYASDTYPLLRQRFIDEARASLPGLSTATVSAPEGVFNALRVQRLRLKHDQQVPEWAG